HFVGQLYRHGLPRDVAPSGLAHGPGMLDRGTSRTEVARQIEASQEYRAGVVRELYAALLHRDADPSGLATFTAHLGAGGTVEQMTIVLVSSPEYYQQHGGDGAGFLAGVYRDVLGRDLDAGGAAVFGRALASGLSRGQAVTLIVGSPEYQQHAVRGFYQTYLGRDADATGLAAFAAALARRVRREDVIAMIL